MVLHETIYVLRRTETVVVFFQFLLHVIVYVIVLYKCLNNTYHHDYIIQTVQNILAVRNKGLKVST